MVSRVKTVAFQGVDVTEVEVQVQLSPGVPHFAIVGLPDKAVGESKERVRAAISAMGLSLPAKRIIVNLAPADLAKEGSHFDLPIAIGLLIAMDVLPEPETANYWALGELSLDGRILTVNGVLPAAIGASANQQKIICPQSCGEEAAWAGIDVLAAPSLLALINHFKGTQLLATPECRVDEIEVPITDMQDIRGQHMARRALEVVAAGAHNLLMSGPPGAGKSMLASCLQGILPPLSSEEMLEVSMIASVAGQLAGGKLRRLRPYRDPHHSSSMAAMVGGGKRALPGEISLAHRGVLFLDELPEFPRTVLEALRQPLENGKISVARAAAHVTYPANVQFIAAMNPCRCGYLDDVTRNCGKAPRCAVEYQSKLSGPLLDRIDVHIDVPAVDTLDMLSDASGEPSARVAERVRKARDIQAARYAKLGVPIITNADASGELLTDCALPDGEARELLETATRSLKLTMRGLTRVLRVGRTIADLETSEKVKAHHIAEAISYRQLNYGRNTEAL